ncbi:hypothetical protein A3Q56_02730 [Intoshia linei]|uniref:HTH CENPB-type domain-containing protein n=1 Tax=Intoshia linei TaxID=1819745 RepID=A0A177B5F1_9BILA|nr:hypothetical protein A3Q56_02730 [Intoshia linei]
MLNKLQKTSEKMGQENFTASTGWLDKFKKRHNIKYKSLKGEANFVNINLIDKFKEDFKTLSKNYDKKNIFNCDKAGEKLTPLVIYKSKKPQCFISNEHIIKNLNIDNTSQNKAWMTTTIFLNWLQNENKQ